MTNDELLAHARAVVATWPTELTETQRTMLPELLRPIVSRLFRPAPADVSSLNTSVRRAA